MLDTNVLMHDPTSLFRFEEHDIYLPMLTLEELDNNKKGVTEVARNARQASRFLDELVSAMSENIGEGIPLDAKSGGAATGRLYLQTDGDHDGASRLARERKADNQILAVVMHLQHLHVKRHVVLVSKDINMRIKARALGIAAEDYFNDKVLEDTELLYSGMTELPADFWDKHGKDMESWQQGGQHATTGSRGPLVPSLLVNEFVYHEKPARRRCTRSSRRSRGRTAVLQTLKDYTHQKNNVWGITARNREQNFALNLLMNPDVDFVTLLGQAGTGKTLLTLAAGLMQTLEFKVYSRDHHDARDRAGRRGHRLPARHRRGEDESRGWARSRTTSTCSTRPTTTRANGAARRPRDLIRSRIKVKSLNFMRGRTFINKFLIIDEAQNLTPKQMKTLITRAGPGTKVVCLGNIAQIDTPYLTEGSSGITYVVDRFKGWSHSGHVTLQRGERSRLADHAAEIL